MRLTGSGIHATHIRYLCALVALLVVLGWLFIPSGPRQGQNGHRGPRPSEPGPELKPLDLTRAENTTVVGLVFYGRRDRSSILDCYVRRNLRAHGGWLDEVVWGVNTTDKEDLVYLELLLERTREYRKVELSDPSYIGLWNKSVEAGKIYVKLDDDVVFIDDDAIPLMVGTLLSYPESMLVSANMVNAARLISLHFRTGAILPYLPELGNEPADEGRISSKNNPIWRASELPPWKRPEGFQAFKKIRHWEEYFKNETSTTEGLLQHRWLPVQGQNALYHTPIADAEYLGFGRGLFSWTIAAQQHYSLLDHLENGRKYLYTLSHGSSDVTDMIWDMTGHRLSINFIAIRGEVILDNLSRMAEWNDDELYLTVELPRQMNKRVTVHTRALGAHYSYKMQHALDRTDVLARYRAYAMENVCPGDFLDPTL